MCVIHFTPYVSKFFPYIFLILICIKIFHRQYIGIFLNFKTSFVYFLELTKLDFSHFLNNEITNNLRLWFCYSVIVFLWWFCVCNAKCVVISMSKHLIISTKFDKNILHCNTSGCFFGKIQTMSKMNYGFCGSSGPF